MANGLSSGVQAGLGLGQNLRAGIQRRRQAPLLAQQQQLPLLVEGARRINIAQDPQTKLNILNTMRQNFSTAGISTELLDQGIQQLQSGAPEDLAAFQQGIDQLTALGQQQAGRQFASPRAFEPVQTISPEGEVGLGVTTFDPAKGVGFEQVPLGDLRLVKETPGERREEDVLAAIERQKGVEKAKADEAARRSAEVTRGKGVEARRQGVIDLGLNAVRAIPTLRRVIKLLDVVDTGGIDAAILTAKQKFGLESANEGELMAGLGKAILAQLRPIFGAQFTEREGTRLERIEASKGKNSKTNRRLINNLIQTIERDAQSSIDAAVKAKDFDTAKEIQELLDFDILTEEEQVQAPGPAQAEFLGIE